MQKKAVILINVGTPDSPETPHVRKYLLQFLNDGRVIDIPGVLRKILVNGMIVPFRARKSALLYKKLWTENGSPLLMYLNSLTTKLQKELDAGYQVYGAMRYGNPSLESVIQEVKYKNFQEILIVPLYPQYASSTTGSAFELVMDLVRKWNVLPSIRFISQFYSHPSFIKAFVSRINEYNPASFAHVIFSYHGLPLSHIRKTHQGKEINKCTCEVSLPEHGAYCYKATCYETTRLLARELGLTKNSYTTSFQSRLSKNWLEPFTDKILIELAGKGIKNVLVIAPSFVADCLETSVELGIEYKRLFEQHGGNRFVWVESLNDNPLWVKGIANIIELAE